MNNARTWINWMSVIDRRKPEYLNGVREFLDFAFEGKGDGDVMRCPCVSCNNQMFHDRQVMFGHLLYNGILKRDDIWVYHGESESQEGNGGDVFEGDLEIEDDDFALGGMAQLVHDVAKVGIPTSVPEGKDDGQNVGDRSRIDDNEVPLMELMEDVEADLYPGCKTFKRLEFIMELLRIKVENRWSDNSFSILLETLHKAFNYDENFPKNAYQAKRYRKTLGLNYVKIDACVNHCVLFRKEHAGKDDCPKCFAPRWKESIVSGGNDSDVEGLHNQTKVPQLVLRHFPLIPRLQRMFMCSELAVEMRWHKERRPDDGVMRHPADSKAWKDLAKLYPDFAKDSRNVWLGLSTDGFNPGAQLSSRYSIWPVFLVPYNVPPWLCMKSDNLILSLIIPGPRAPGNDIDVFLQPLIDELKELWEFGVKTFDAYSREMFNMRAMLLWTIQDFPAYANLSGWSTKGTLACPECHINTCSRRLAHGHKWCYMDHRIFLEPDHKFRSNRSSFGGKTERRPPPKGLSGHDILEQLSGFDNVKFGKNDKGKRKRGDRYLVHQWKKKSIFLLELPYWRHVLVRHNLDVMHVEKNICDSIIGTILDIAGKNKDTLNARLDLASMSMHGNLRPKLVGDKYQVPCAPFNLTLAERRQVATVLSNLSVLDNYSSNIARCVSLEDGRVFGMKSHDCHVFMQDLLTPAFHGIVDDKMLEPLRELSLYFKQLCSRTLSIDMLEQMEKNIPITLCKLERVFIPSFFDVMMHLPVHLANQAKLAGPVQYRWMYPFEREMGDMKKSVGNKACPEGSIAEAYIEKECLAFCSRYLSKTEVAARNDGGDNQSPHRLSVFSNKGKTLGKANIRRLTLEEWKQAHMYVLRNCVELRPFLDEYDNVTDHHGEDFFKWLESRITQLWNVGDKTVTEELLCLSRGPMKGVMCYDGFVVNGSRFHTKRRQRKRKTQNSGVVVKGDEQVGERDFYGVLEEVIVLEYDALRNRTSPNVVLFKCKWFDVYNEGRGFKRDRFGSTFVNMTRRLQTDEPFALASQMQQVFYVETHNNPNWRVVIKTNPRNYFDFPNNNNIEDDESSWESGEMPMNHIAKVQEGNDEYISLIREDVEPSLVDAAIIQNIQNEEDDLEVEETEDEEEEEFSDSESSVASLDRDLEEDESDSDNSEDMSHSSQ